MKRCTKCGIEKASECFAKNRSAKDGLVVRCRVCRKASDAAYRATPEGKAKCKAANAAWYATPEGRAKKKAYVTAYKDSPEGRAKLKVYSSIWYTAWYATPEGKAKAKATAAAYLATPEGNAKAKAAKTIYLATPEGNAKNLAKSAKHRSRKLNAPGPHHTAKQWVDKRAEYDQRCAYCFRKPKRLTLDHVVPLSKGGSNAISNCVPACATCNSSKGPKDLRVWLGIVIESRTE